MKRRLLVLPMLVVCLGLTQGAFADGFAVKSGHTIRDILETRKGTRVTLRLSDGGELTGKVRNVTQTLVQLGELDGRDYFDGVIRIEKISAVIVRVKQ